MKKKSNIPQVHIRIGLHTGPVVGGVIGKSKFQYDVWGSTVNMASRMESTGLPSRIQVSRQTYERLHDSFKFEARDNVYVKGIGNVTAYVLDDTKLPDDLMSSLSFFFRLFMSFFNVNFFLQLFQVITWRTEMQSKCPHLRVFLFRHHCQFIPELMKLQ